MKIVLSFVIALLAVVIIFLRIIASPRREPKPIPFDGLILIFWHCFQEKGVSRTSNFIALEIDWFRVSGPLTYATTFLISNSGFRRYGCKIDSATRRVIEFQGKVQDGMYAVFWVPAEEGRIMIYDTKFVPGSRVLGSYYWRYRWCKEFSGERRSTKGLEKFSIRYCQPPGLELETRNRGLLEDHSYLEIYRLIYDNAGA